MMDDQNTNNPSDSQTENVDAANSELLKEQAAEAAGTPDEASENPFAALKESEIASEKAPRNDEEAVEAKDDESEGEGIAEPEVKEPEEVMASKDADTIEAIGASEETKAEDAKSASSEPVTEETAPEEEPVTSEEPKEEEKPAVPANPNARWYVVHTFAGHENKVATALRQRIEAERLENLIYDILVPTQDKIEIKGGKKETVKEKIFPGYILIKMELSDISWLAVRTTQGVTSFIGAGNKPTPISEAEVATIVKFTTQGASPTFKDVFMVDDTVKIVDGPFAEFIGKVDSVDKEKGRVRVLVSIFGRETPVELDFLQVQKL